MSSSSHSIALRHDPVVTTTGRVRSWQDNEGWGVIDCSETPGGCWAHFSVVAVAGYKALAPGQDVALDWEPAQQDGYSYRAVRTWPADRPPVVDRVDPPRAQQACSSTLTITHNEPVPAVLPRAPLPPAGSSLVDWITGSTQVGRTITAAIPRGYARYTTVVIPADDATKTLADAALVEVLQAHTPVQPWWLGYLDTGDADLVNPEAPRVAVYVGWPYVLLEGGPEQALTARRNAACTPWHSALPELVFPRDRSWLVSTLWDDDWRCIGGPAALVDSLLLRPELKTRVVTPDENATPPGHTAN